MAPPAKSQPPEPSKLKTAAVDAVVAVARVVTPLGVIGGFIALQVQKGVFYWGWMAVALGAVGAGLFAWKRKGRDLAAALLGIGPGVASLVLGPTTTGVLVAFAGAALCFVALNLWVLDLFRRREA